MTHAPALPFLLPALTGCALLFLDGRIAHQRAVSLASSFAQLLLGAWLAWNVRDGGILSYAFGNWPSHLGIVFVVDPLSVTLICLTAIVAVPALWHATHGWDGRGPHFHALFHFQWMGLAGAFLAGDLFNLFVCFELMLIASYALLVHGGGPARFQAGLRYVVLNLVGSALFLVAVGLLYRVAGTLNLADLGVALAAAGPDDAPWIRAGGLLLTVVFLLKGALLPLSLWLPGTYLSAAAPVAAIFAVVTKVGAYAVLRVTPVAFGGTDVAPMIADIVWPLAIATVLLAAIGALAAVTLSQLAAWLALGSSASTLLGIGQFSAGAAAGGVFYSVAGTIALAALFLFGDVLTAARGGRWQDRLCRAPKVAQSGRLGGTFLIVAIAVAGLPPLAPFLGKALLLQGIGASAWGWGGVLIASLLTIVALARAGSRLFWAVDDAPCPGDPDAGTPGRLAPVFALIGALVVLTVAGGVVSDFVVRAVQTALSPSAYIDEVLGPERVRWVIRLAPPRSAPTP